SPCTIPNHNIPLTIHFFFLESRKKLLSLQASFWGLAAKVILFTQIYVTIILRFPNNPRPQILKVVRKTHFKIIQRDSIEGPPMTYINILLLSINSHWQRKRTEQLKKVYRSPYRQEKCRCSKKNSRKKQIYEPHK